MLRRVLLAASASSRLRQLITTTPRTRAIVDSYVAGETEQDAVRVTRALRAAGLLVSLDYLGEDTRDPAQAAAVTDEYIEPSIALVERRAKPIQGGIVAEVERSECGRAAGGAHCVVKLLKSADGPRQSHHMRAAARKQQGGRVADAARGAGDERDPISKRLWHSLVVRF